MLRNFDQTMKDLEGKPIKDENEKEITLKSIAVGALMASYPDEQNLSGEEKFKRYNLAVKINKGGEIEVSAEDISDLKKLIGKGFSVLAVGSAYKLLEANSKE